MSRLRWELSYVLHGVCDPPLELRSSLSPVPSASGLRSLWLISTNPLPPCSHSLLSPALQPPASQSLSWFFSLLTWSQPTSDPSSWILYFYPSVFPTSTLHQTSLSFGFSHIDNTKYWIFFSFFKRHPYAR